MLFEAFIFRFLRLEQRFISVLAVEDNKISFRANDEAKEALSNLEDLLNTLLEGKDGKFVFSFNFAEKCLDFKFVEGGC